MAPLLTSRELASGCDGKAATQMAATVKKEHIEEDPYAANQEEARQQRGFGAGKPGIEISLDSLGLVIPNGHDSCLSMKGRESRRVSERERGDASNELETSGAEVGALDARMNDKGKALLSEVRFLVSFLSRRNSCCVVLRVCFLVVRCQVCSHDISSLQWSCPD